MNPDVIAGIFKKPVSEFDEPHIVNSQDDIDEMYIFGSEHLQALADSNGAIEEMYDCSNPDTPRIEILTIRGIENTDTSATSMVEAYLQTKKQEGLIRGDWHIDQDMFLIMRQEDVEAIQNNIGRSVGQSSGISLKP